MLTNDVANARALLANTSRVVVLSGAGISTASGIPDFRGKDGIWTKDPKAEMLSNFDTWVSDPEVRTAAWRSRASRSIFDVEPNDGHRAIVDLERQGRLLLLVTQNIDGLHQRAGSDPDLVVEIHGSALDAVCLRCGHREPIGATLDRVRAGEDDPTCRQIVSGAICGGILKSGTISFGQSLVASDLARAERAAASADCLIAVGTTLAVYPVAGLVPIAARSGATVIICNDAPTQMDDLADVVVRGDLTEVLPALFQN